MDSKALQQQSSTTKSVSASEIPKVMQFLESKSNNRLEFLVDDSNTEIGMNRSHEENLTLTTTLTDQIKMVTNNYGKSNYTFELIEQGDKSSTYFLNLVVKEYKDELYMYIVKYVPDATWLETHHMIKDFNVFTGYIYFYSDIGTYIGKVDMANGVASSGFDKHPCDDESSESENTNNGSSTTSSNNGTTGGNSGGLDCYPYLMWYECGGTNSNIPHGTTGPMACGVPGGSGSGWTLVIVCQESFRDLQNVLRHPCDGGSNGGGVSTSSLSCETITGNTCDNQDDIFMEWDENCNCVEAEAIEGSVVSTIYFEKEYQMFLDDLDEDAQEFLEENTDLDEEIRDYFEENGFSEEAEEFVAEFTDIVLIINEAKFQRFKELKEKIEENPWVLIQNCAEQNGLDIANYQMLYEHSLPNECNERLNILGSDFEDQPLSEGNAAVANVDYYGVEITIKPDFDNNGYPDNENQIYQKFRENFPNLASGGEEDFEFSCNVPFNNSNTGNISWTFLPYFSSDITLWNSTNPITTIFKIDAEADISGIPTWMENLSEDDGAIMISDFTQNYWIGSTITTQFSDTQPFSGNRQWGWIINQNGNLELFARAVDVARVSNFTRNNPLADDECSEDTYYNIGEATWSNLQEEIANWINENGGQAEVLPKTAIRFTKEKLKEILESNETITEINCD